MRTRLTIADLADLEFLLRQKGKAVLGPEKIRSLGSGTNAMSLRREGFLCWLSEARKQPDLQSLPSHWWNQGRPLIGFILSVIALVIGIGVISGLLDRERMAFNVPLLIGVTVVLPLLVMAVVFFFYLLRGAKAKKSGGGLMFLLGIFFGKSGKKQNWLYDLRVVGGNGWRALGWNVFALSQAVASFFTIGLILGLIGHIWFFEIGFYWESTTSEWIALRLRDIVGILSSPWSQFWPQGSPDLSGIQTTRWSIGGEDARWRAGSATIWTPFLLAAMIFWGLLPRWILFTFGKYKERKSLRRLDFQSKRYRSAWREIAGARQEVQATQPTDGVLVLDVGGTGIKAEALRGFLLRELRVNPGEWLAVSTWDEADEAAATESIQSAPAGVVFLVEGWALSPARMRALHKRVRSLAGSEVLITMLVVNSSDDGMPNEATDEEKAIWRSFSDGMPDPLLDLRFYEKEK